MSYDYTKKKQDETYDSDVNARALQMIRDNAAQKRQQALQPLTQQKNEALSAYLNHGDFQYDVNTDALYQQYRDYYTHYGRKAMEDTMGQAAALTGGYGSSYAQHVGQQAYNEYMQGLNNVIPELYQMAYSKHQDKSNELLQRYSLLAGEEEAEYAKWLQKEQDAVSDYQWQTAYDYQAEQDRLAAQQSALQAALKTATTTEQESILEKPVYSYVDDEGLYHYYLGGKEVKYGEGVNPLTGTINPDVQHGTFGVTGYQPSHITINGKAQKLEKSGYTDMINGHTQNIWKAENGSLWMWDDTKNAYTRYTGSKMANKIVNTDNVNKIKASIGPKEHYGGDEAYKKHVKDKIEEAESYLTDDEVYTLGVLYGLIDPPENIVEKYGYHLPG